MGAQQPDAGAFNFGAQQPAAPASNPFGAASPAAPAFGSPAPTFGAPTPTFGAAPAAAPPAFGSVQSPPPQQQGSAFSIGAGGQNRPSGQRRILLLEELGNSFDILFSPLFLV